MNPKKDNPDNKKSDSEPIKPDTVAESSSQLVVSAGNHVIGNSGNMNGGEIRGSDVIIEKEEIVHVVISPMHSPINIDEQPLVARYAPVWELFKVVLIPAMILLSIVMAIALLGLAQKTGWVSAGSGNGTAAAEGAADSGVSYICPMMCVPPTTAPGRCPVCAMELVPASAGASAGPSSTIQIDSRSRCVSGIQTAEAQSRVLIREIRGVGEISYDESKLKTLSAYIEGRIEELYADYTGIQVKQGDSLALLYSPELYAAQIEYLQTIDSDETTSGSSSRLENSSSRLRVISRERLVELGMTESQIVRLEQEKKADRRLELHAPMSGTVIEKMAVAGQYLQAGAPVYRLADLSTVWLVLELFPEDASSIRNGQPVMATAQSLPDQVFEGEVEFIEPLVDPKTRTVGVRVAISNPEGMLKPGEFARASLKVPVLSVDGET